MNKVGVRNWFSLIIAGLVGQLAWAIENMFLNLYIFEQTQDASFVPWMVAFSAVAATLTTFFMGVLSDRLGKRKAFISFGYIAWGLSIGLFAFITVENMRILFPSANAVFLTGVFIIVFDCIMTFFGSTANDAAFNAYATDISTPETSGKIEAVLSILPLISMLVIFGGFSGMAKGEGWKDFFLIFGVLTLVAGIASIFVFPKDTIKPQKDEKYFKKLVYGFRPSVIKTNPRLYITLLSTLTFGIAMQTFMPYFLIHIQKKLQIVDLEFTIIMAVVLLLASVITVIMGVFFINKHTNKIMIGTLIITMLGLVGMSTAKTIVPIIVFGTIFMSGNMVGGTILGSKIRDYTPRDEVGLFQGVRMIFGVLLPMIIGPFIGELAYSQTSETYINDYGQAVKLPNEFIYLAAAIVLVLAFIPLIALFKKEKEWVSHE